MKHHKMTNRLIVTMLSLLMLFSAGPFFFAENMNAYAETNVTTWEELQTAIDDGESEITLAANFPYNGTSVLIQSGNDIIQFPAVRF